LINKREKYKIAINMKEQDKILTRSGKELAKASLYHILSNKVYLGKIVQKNKEYDGLHVPIIKIQNHLENYPIEQQKIILEKMQNFEADKVFLRTAIKRVDLFKNGLYLNQLQYKLYCQIFCHSGF